jgi:hypothetical protein
MTTIDKTTVSISDLRTAIKDAERAYKFGYWLSYARQHVFTDEYQIKALDRGFLPDNSGYVEHVTGLYTLRAWLRGKLHRLNPPAPIRDFNRSMRATGRVELEWDAAKHNRELAEKYAPKFPVKVDDPYVDTGLRAEIAADLATAAQAADLPGVNVSALGRTITFAANG